MSLHLGNLSSRVRRDELERVFRRFGRCSIQVRDKFGFVVYDYPVNAERALKTLQGKKICGELLTLTWSNRQPRPVARVRGGKSYDSRHGRKNSRIENYVKRKLPSDGQQNSRMAYHQPDEPNNNLLENDRWENELENVSEFDRYEPYNDDEDKRADDEINHDVRQGEDFQQRNGDVTRKTRQGCYNCGELGHKRRNCPQERESKKKLNRFDYKRNDNGTNNERMKRTREIRSPERHRERKSRRPNSNLIHSDAKVSKYSKPTTWLASNPDLKSRSLSCSSSSSSSSSRSHSRRSRTHRWRSRSRSRSRSGSSSDASLNVSTSCGRSSIPSPSKLQQSSEKDSFTKATTSPQQKEVDTMDTNHIKKCEEDRNSDLDGGVNERGTAMVNDEKRSRVIITSEEMLMVIKHYGLKKDDDYDDDDDDKESFFGCGRLWPWEVIYYRRLKKGPISRENYARRISQNQEFGIVDRYVRSSSGWGEVVDQTL